MNVSVNYAVMSENSEDLATALVKIGNQVAAVKQTRNRGISVGKSSSQIKRQINRIVENLEQERTMLGTMKTKLVAITASYRQCEQNLAGSDQLTDSASDAVSQAIAGGAVSFATMKTTTETGDMSGEKTYLNSTLIKLLGEVGIVGSGLASILTWGSSGDWIKNALSSAKFVTKAIGKGASAVSSGGTSSDWADALWGTTNALAKVNTSSVGAAFTSSLTNQLKELFPDNIATTADGVKLGTKWLGNLLTVATNGYENYQEMQEDGISAGRAVAETVVESVTDIGLGMLATAAVTSAAVAIGITYAPALAIGLASAGVVWAANGVCKWATKTFFGEEKDIGEVVADTVCDIGEGAVQLVKTGAEAVGNAVENAVDTVSNAVEDAVDTVKSGVENVKNTLSTAWSGFCGVFA